jgi:hypothetical protein
VDEADGGRVACELAGCDEEDAEADGEVDEALRHIPAKQLGPPDMARMQTGTHRCDIPTTTSRDPAMRFAERANVLSRRAKDSERHPIGDGGWPPDVRVGAVFQGPVSSRVWSALVGEPLPT